MFSTEALSTDSAALDDVLNKIVGKATPVATMPKLFLMKVRRVVFMIVIVPYSKSTCDYANVIDPCVCGIDVSAQRLTPGSGLAFQH